MSAFEIANLIWLSGFMGFCAGVIIQKKMYERVLKIKATDGTGEYINGKMYYIIDDSTYCKAILGIDKGD